MKMENSLTPFINSNIIETEGPLKSTIKIDGVLRQIKKNRLPILSPELISF
jgi:hypothetical protein